MLEQLKLTGLRLKHEKCRFTQMEVGYLGHVASAEGLQTDLAKLQAVIEFSVCQDIEVISGIGIIL